MRKYHLRKVSINTPITSYKRERRSTWQAFLS